MAHAYLHNVRFDETDLAGIVHFSHYAKWVESAEHSLLKHIGIPIISAQGGFPKVNFTINYKKPVRFDDQITIELSVTEVGTSSVHYAFEITRDNESLASGKLATVYVTREGIPQTIPPQWKEAFLTSFY